MSMKLDIVSYGKSVAGRRHQFYEIDNQDHMNCYENGKISVSALSDGCSGCKYPALAAEITDLAALQLAQNEKIWNMDEEAFRKAAADQFQELFSVCSEPDAELCATTAFVIVNKETWEYIAFSVGDSAVLAVDENLNIRQLLEPVNGMRKTQTFFTNDRRDVIKVGCYSRGRLSAETAGFILYTDGAESLAEPPFSDAKHLVTSALISQRMADQFAEEYLEKTSSCLADDISFAAVMVRNEQTMRAARLLCSSCMPEPERTTQQAVLPFSAGHAAQPDADDRRTRIADTPFVQQEEPRAVQMPRVLQFLHEPRTADALIGAEIGLSRENFASSILTLLRLDLVTVSAGSDGRLLFRSCMIT